MTAILFGSISTVVDTSERQRLAFNQAFAAHGLDWEWDRDEYLALLESSGGQQRIADHARSVGATVDAAAIHQTKTELFQADLAASPATPRDGVVDTIRAAREHGVQVGIVTTTSVGNVEAVLAALEPAITRADFAAVLSADDATAPKPDGAVYALALERLGEEAGNCVAIEDNLGGVAAAGAAGLACVAFPNANTAAHDFAAATERVDHLDFEQLQRLAGAQA